MKKVLLFILIFIGLIYPVKATKLVSVGDSIPNGYLLKDQNNSYDNLIANTLNLDYYEFSYIGMRSDDLLRELDRTELRNNIMDADIIFVNIGANDLLDLLDYIDYSKFNIKLEYGENTKINLSDDKITELINYLRNFFYNELVPKSEEALLDFKETFPAIITKIKEYNPNIKIYVNTIYNPFFNLKVPFLNYDLSFIEDISDQAITSFNNVIYASDEYEIMDIYHTLRDNKYLNINIFNGLFDPHPNKLGHKKIYELYLDKMCYKVKYDNKIYYVLKGESLDIKPKTKKGYYFSKWNYDLNNIDRDITLKAIYKKKNNYIYFIAIGIVAIIISLIIKKKNR